MATENLPAGLFLRGLSAGLFLGEARMLTIILRGGVETQSLKTTGLNKMWPNVFAKCEIAHNVLL